MAIRIVIASKRNLVSEGFSAQLRQHADFQVCGCTDNLEQFEQFVQTYEPKIIVIGYSFQETNTAQFIRAFLRTRPETKFIVSGYHIDHLTSAEILASGANAFIFPFHDDFEELTRAIRSALSSDQKYFGPKVKAHLDRPRYTVTHKRSTDTLLSDREIAVLQLIAEGRSSKEIARELSIAPSTVEVHRRNMMKKVGVHKAVDLARYAIRMNLVES